jgi:pimeloyl-ACP methyl ester carboxylesterase
MGPKMELVGRPAPARRGWVRRAQRAAVVGGAAALVATGTTTAVRRARSRRADDTRRDPSGVSDQQLPDGQSLVVTTEDGADLAVTVAGPDDGPAVVLAHCWTGSRAIWAPVAHRLVLGGHRVVLYDQRGHGQSTCSDAPPSVDGLGHDLRAVLEATDAQDAVLVGHSMGGMTIQSYAALHPEHFAERARAVVLVATAARVLGRPIPSRVIHRALGDGRQEWTRRGPVGRALVRGSLGRQPQRAHIDLTLESFASTTGVARAGFLAAMATMDLRGGLAHIAVPAAVLVGTRDLLTPPRLGRQLAAGIPDAQLTVLPGAGHMLPLEAPDRIVEAVRATSSRATTRGPAPALQ